MTIMNNYIIYKYTSPSGKIYIGQTCLGIRKRAGVNGEKYLRKNKDGNFNQPLIANAILKYGWDNFTKEILFKNLSQEEANEKEIEMIEYYKSSDRRYGYNIRSGGESYSEKDRKRMSESIKAKWEDPNSGFNNMTPYWKDKKLSREAVDKMVASRKETLKNFTEEEYIEYCRKQQIHKINQYDLDGNFIKQWLSLYELEQAGFNKHNIQAVCTRRKTSRGYTVSTYKNFQWRYSDDCEDIKPYSRPKKYSNCKQFRKIARVDNDSNIIKEYESIVSASRDLNISEASIQSVCVGRSKNTKDGYIFKYLN